MKNLASTLALLATCSALVAQCPSGTSYGSGDDFVANAGNGIAIGFSFPYAGTTYDFIHPCSNGFAWLSDGSAAITVADYTPTAAEFATQGARVAPFWDDLNLIAGNGAQLLVESTPAKCTVTWNNAVNFGTATIFSLSMSLFPDGHMEFTYGGTIYNSSQCFVGITPGGLVGASTPIDMTALSPSTDDMTWEDFATANTFDMVDQTVSLFPTAPGFVPVVTPNLPCATKATYGTGCIQAAGGADYEQMPLAGWDLTGTVSLLRGTANYTMTNAVPGTFVTPTASAIVAVTGDDAVGVVSLSAPMPCAGGSTTSLTVCTNGYIALANVPTLVADYSPSVAEFVSRNVPVIAGPWYDWNPTAGGQILFEEIGGIAYVTWNNVLAFGQVANGDTFQYQFNLASGDVQIVFQTMNLAGASAWHTPLFGYTAGNNPLPVVGTAHDMSADLAATITTPDAQRPLTIDGTRPSLGAAWSITTGNIDPLLPFSFTFLGDQAVDPGLPLGIIGLNAPGCSIYINTVLGSLTGVGVAGTSVVTLPIPNNAALVGATLSAQSICLTLANPANLLSSNGLLGTIGY